MSDEIYRYLNFHQIESFQNSADQIIIPAVNVVAAS
jgi:hypothetical protein